MIEIQGAYNRAICYTDALEETAREQLVAVCGMEAFAGARIRVMPDVHAGKGCTIGTTMTVTDRVAPAMVGVDIGCGMYTVALKGELSLPVFDEAAHAIPSGMEVWEGRQERFDLTALRCFRALRDSKRLERSLGTLGGGNHFIEIDEDGCGKQYLVIHSGSRNLGKQVADYYQRLAVELLNEGKEDYFRRRNELIAAYKAEGRRQEIHAALQALEREWKRQAPALPAIPAELCYLHGEYMEDYLHDVALCQRFALRNREKIAELLLEKSGLSAGEAFHTVHNYIDVEEGILRKGAVSAKRGERLLIPINMRDGSLLCEGLGNEEWNFSVPHGAGRLMSRTAALERLTMAEYEAAMRGIYTTCVTPATLDESPMAYKSIESILSAITPTVRVLQRLKPIYNFKAADAGIPFDKSSRM